MAITFDNNSNRHSQRGDREDIDPMGADGMTILFEKYQVHSCDFDMVAAQFEKIRPFLLRDTYYTWQDLLGEEFWSDMPSMPTHLASICLQHIAAQPGSQLRVLPSSDGDPTYFIFREHKG